MSWDMHMYIDELTRCTSPEFRAVAEFVRRRIEKLLWMDVSFNRCRMLPAASYLTVLMKASRRFAAKQLVSIMMGARSCPFQDHYISCWSTLGLLTLDLSN
jgi:hypothetical protein